MRLVQVSLTPKLFLEFVSQANAAEKMDEDFVSNDGVPMDETPTEDFQDVEWEGIRIFFAAILRDRESLTLCLYLQMAVWACCK